jgi:hypothetical protein
MRRTSRSLSLLRYEDVEDPAQNMVSIKLRRLPILNEQKRTVGISLVDVAVSHGANHTSEALSGISRAQRRKCQATDSGRRG